MATLLRARTRQALATALRSATGPSPPVIVVLQERVISDIKMIKMMESRSTASRIAQSCADHNERLRNNSTPGSVQRRTVSKIGQDCADFNERQRNESTPIPEPIPHRERTNAHADEALRALFERTTHQRVEAQDTAIEDHFSDRVTYVDLDEALSLATSQETSELIRRYRETISQQARDLMKLRQAEKMNGRVQRKAEFVDENSHTEGTQHRQLYEMHDMRSNYKKMYDEEAALQEIQELQDTQHRFDAQYAAISHYFANQISEQELDNALSQASYEEAAPLIKRYREKIRKLDLELMKFRQAEKTQQEIDGRMRRKDHFVNDEWFHRQD